MPLAHQYLLPSYEPEFSDHRIIQPENLADAIIPEERDDNPGADDTNVEAEMADT